MVWKKPTKISSALRQIPHRSELPIPTAPLHIDNITIPKNSGSDPLGIIGTSSDHTFLPTASHYLLPQNEISNLVRDLGL